LCLTGQAELVVSTQHQTTNLPTRGESRESLLASFNAGRRTVNENYLVECNGMKKDCPLWIYCDFSNGKWFTNVITEAEKIDF
jgi:hypothetical protein